MEYSSSRREFNRIKFKVPVLSTIAATTSLPDSQISEAGQDKIYVIDMSASGLRFLSKFEFEVNFITVYKFQVNVNGKDLLLFGKIIRKKELANKYFEYGVHFFFAD